MKDIVLKTPPGILKEFFDRSSIWEDFKIIIDAWIEDIHEQLENPSGEVSPRMLDRLGGNAESLRRFKAVDVYIESEEGNHGRE